MVLDRSTHGYVCLSLSVLCCPEQTPCDGPIRSRSPTEMSKRTLILIWSAIQIFEPFKIHRLPSWYTESVSFVDATVKCGLQPQVHRSLHISNVKPKHAYKISVVGPTCAKGLGIFWPKGKELIGERGELYKILHCCSPYRQTHGLLSIHVQNTE
jgi:hypothetical protein